MGQPTRDIGLGSNGKGDAPRTRFDSKWAKNYDAINWGKPKQKKRRVRI